MAETPLLTAVLPLFLAVVMFGLGLSLRTADFTRVLVLPRAVLAGLGVQMLLLPGAAAVIAHAFGLSPPMAVGLMLLAASPGGVMANLFSHFARGDVALNITLTAINSVLAVVSLPLIVNLSTRHFMGEEQIIPLQFGKVMQVCAIVLVPVLLGMLVNARAGVLAEALRRPMKGLSLAFLAGVIVFAGIENRDQIGEHIRAVGAACLTFNLISLAVGYGLPRLFRLGPRQATAIAMEVGIHNSALAITVALSPLMLADSRMAAPAAVYSVMMFFTAAVFGCLVNRRHVRLAQVADKQATG
jgi:bile acid:Na+ symporter, BASS family